MRNLTACLQKSCSCIAFTNSIDFFVKDCPDFVSMVGDSTGDIIHFTSRIAQLETDRIPAVAPTSYDSLKYLFGIRCFDICMQSQSSTLQFFNPHICHTTHVFLLTLAPPSTSIFPPSFSLSLSNGPDQIPLSLSLRFESTQQIEITQQIEETPPTPKLP